MKYEATTRYYLRYCYSAGRATQNMSASGSLPTTDIVLLLALHNLSLYDPSVRCWTLASTYGKLNSKAGPPSTVAYIFRF